MLSTAIENIVESNLAVQNLVENQWLHIFSIDRDNRKVLYRRAKDKYEDLN